MSDFATENEPVIFWAENYNGAWGEGGYFVKDPCINALFNKIVEQGRTPVGIKFDGTTNIEILVLPKE